MVLFLCYKNLQCTRKSHMHSLWHKDSEEKFLAAGIDFQYCCEPVLIQRILIGFEAILEKIIKEGIKIKY